MQIITKHWTDENLKTAAKPVNAPLIKKYTGVDNELIKQNLEWLLSSKKAKDVIIRTPLIPGMTTSEENIAGIARFISG